MRLDLDLWMSKKLSNVNKLGKFILYISICGEVTSPKSREYTDFADLITGCPITSLLN